MNAYRDNSPYAFISYAHKDGEKALRIIRTFQKKCNVWYDDGIGVGTEWADTISKRSEISQDWSFLKNQRDNIRLFFQLSPDFIKTLVDEIRKYVSHIYNNLSR